MKLILCLVFLISSSMFSQTQQWVNYYANSSANKLCEYENYIWVSGTGLTKIDKTTYEITRYHSKNSDVPDNIKSFAIDNNGIPWIAWDYYLSKFEDDTLITEIWRGPFDTLPGTEIFCVSIDKNNIKWSGWSENLISFNSDQIVQNYWSYLDDNLPYYIESIAFEDSIVWLGSTDGLSKFDGSSFKLFSTSNSGLPSGRINDIAIDLSKTKWLGTSEGIVKYDGNTWEIYNTSNSILTSNYITAISIDSFNTPWIGTNNGLYHFGENWTVYNLLNSPLISNVINDLLVDKENNVWITTAGGGIYKYDKENWKQIFTSNSGLPSNTIKCVAFDKDNVKWIGTTNGLVRFDGKEWKVYNEYNSGLTSNCINDIAIDKHGVLWMATGSYGDNQISWKRGGIASFDGSNWSVYSVSNSGFSTNWINSIEIDDNDNKWIGTAAGLWVLNNGEIKNISFVNTLYSNDVIDIKEDLIGRVYFILRYGDVVLFDGDDWKRIPHIHSGYGEDRINNISIDSENNAWVGYKNGIIKFDSLGHTFYNYLNSCLPSGISVAWINIDKEDNIWIGTSRHGLIKWDGTECITYNMENSNLIEKGVNYINIDEHGNKWMNNHSLRGQNFGLVIFNENGVIVNVDKFDSNSELKPNKYLLNQNYPNPFNPATTIEYSLPQSEYVEIVVYDLLGNKVSTLVQEELSAGSYKVNFDGSNLSSGIYFYRLQTGSFIETKKLVLLK